MLSFVEQDRKRLRPHRCHSWLMSQKVGKKNSQPFSSHLDRKLLALLLSRTEIKEGISLNNKGQNCFVLLRSQSAMAFLSQHPS